MPTDYFEGATLVGEPVPAALADAPPRQGGDGPDFTGARLKEDTIGEQLGAVGRGATTTLLRDVVGGAVDLMNNIPDLILQLPFQELVRKATSLTFREIKRQLDVPEEDLPTSYQERREIRPIPPVSDEPFLGSKMMGNILSRTGAGYRDISEVPKSQRPYAVAGETIAGTGLSAFPFFSAAARGVKAPGFLGQILDSIRENPRRAAAGEVGSALLSGGGAAVAEQLAPGDPHARALAETGTPFAPLAMALRYGPRVARAGRDFGLSYVSPQARTRKAAEKLQLVFRDAEGPEAAAKAAEDIQLARARGIAGTPAQLSGSATLSVIERYLARSAQELGGAVEEATRRAITQGHSAWSQLQQVGDIDALIAAAKARASAHVSALTRIYERGLQLQRQAASRVRIPGAADKRDISKQARRVLARTNELARAHNEELFDAIPAGVVVIPENLAAAFGKVTKDFLPGEALPTGFDAAIRRLVKTDKKTGELANTVTSGQLKHLRTKLLREARRLASSREGHDSARVLGDLAAGILDDLAFDATGIAAREFYKEFAKNFLRGPGGKLFRRIGGETIHPYAALEVSLTGSPYVRHGVGFGRLRRAEALPGYAGTVSRPHEPISAALRVAAGLPRQLGEPTELAILQSDFLLRMAADTIDESGKVNLAGLRSFMKANEGAIQDLGLDQFGNLEKATVRLQEIKRAVDEGKHYANKISNAALIVSDPRKRISEALDSTDAIKKFRDLARVARGDKAAMEGLRYALFEQLLSRSRSAEGQAISGLKLSEILDLPIRAPVRGAPPQPTLREVLKRVGILTPEHDKGLDAVIDRFTKLEMAMNDPRQMDDLLGQPNDLLDLAFRLIGTQAAQRSPIKQNVGSSLVMAHAASQASRKWFGKVPRLGIRNILIEAINNPDLMAELLVKDVSLPAKRARERAINAFLIQAGMRMAATDEERQ